MSKALQRGIPIIRNTEFGGNDQDSIGLVGIPVKRNGKYVLGGKIIGVICVFITHNSTDVRIREYYSKYMIPKTLDTKSLRFPQSNQVLAILPPQTLDKLLQNRGEIEVKGTEIGL